MRKVELLSPAGNMECLKAAIEAGCDAVYIGGKLFSARGFAGNFTDDEIIEAIKYAHLYGVKVYVTINTIIYQREVNTFLNYVRFSHQNNVDAVIIEDIGMFYLLKNKFPNLTIHASTQMNIHNYEGALLAKKLGFKRVVMARETPLEVIEKIKKDIDIELEVFIHGALCVCYSGQCLASALIGNRSANRGTCAQICRKKYNLYDRNNNKLNDNNYLLSTKDLCTLENLSEIIKTGVCSLKIEGRMKRKEYVYLVTKIYRLAIDSYYENKKIDFKKCIINLKKMFNRGFTKGFMLEEENNLFANDLRPNHLGVKIGKVKSKVKDNLIIKLNGTLSLNDGIRILDEKEDTGFVVTNMRVNNEKKMVANSGEAASIKCDKYIKKGSDVLLTTDYNMVKEIDKLIKDNKRRVLIDVIIEAKENKPLKIKVTDTYKNTVTYESNYVVEKAINNSITKDQIIKQISKTGNTIYKLGNVKVNMDDNIFINIKALNDLRRKALLLLDDKRLYQIPFKENEFKPNIKDFKKEEKMSALINSKDDYFKVKDKADTIYVSDKSLLLSDKCVLKLPRIINKYEDYNKKVLVGEFGSLLKYKNFDTDFSFNVVNSYSVYFLHKLGAQKVTLSYELNYAGIKCLIDEYESLFNAHPNVEVIKDSYPEAMVCKYNLGYKYKFKEAFLEDEYKNKYKIVNNDSYMTIYNFKKITFDEEELYKLGVNSVRTNI